MSYQDDMKDVMWQKRRLLILERDKWKCQESRCTGKSTKLEVHHLDYIPDKKIWEYPDDMLLTLCSTCHNKEQERPPAEKMLLNSMRMKGFMLGDLLSLSVTIDNKQDFTKWLLHTLRKQQNG